MKKLLLVTVIVCAFMMTACGQDKSQNGVAVADNNINKVDVIEKSYSNDYPNVSAFESKYLEKANIITKKKIGANNSNYRIGTSIGCIYKGKLFWTGYKVNMGTKKIESMYLFTSNKDFSNIRRKKLNYSGSGSFQETVIKHSDF